MAEKHTEYVCFTLVNKIKRKLGFLYSKTHVFKVHFEYFFFPFPAELLHRPKAIDLSQMEIKNAFWRVKTKFAFNF